MINNIEKALSIIDANYCGKPDSLLGEINDHSFFCNDKFWELYIMSLTKICRILRISQMITMATWREWIM